MQLQYLFANCLEFSCLFVGVEQLVLILVLAEYVFVISVQEYPQQETNYDVMFITVQGGKK